MKWGQQIRDYGESLVRQKGMVLAPTTCQVTKAFLVRERFKLISQLQCIAVSVPSNRAKGQARYTTGIFFQFISPAEDSLVELNPQFIMRVNLEY
jgi:four helix bundle protein